MNKLQRDVKAARAVARLLAAIPARRLREAAADWRNVVAAQDPSHEDYADPGWRTGVLEDWREDFGEDDLAALTVAFLVEYLGDR